MNIQEAVVQMLLAGGDWTPALGTNVFPGKAPQGVAVPYAVIALVSGNYTKSLNQGRSGQAQHRLQIAVYADFSADADPIVQAIGAKLDGYRGSLGPGQPFAQGIFFDDDYANYHPPAHEDDVGRNASLAEFDIWTG